MTEYIPIRFLRPEESYNQVFLIGGVEFRKNTKGSYLAFHCHDVTGRIKGCIWNVDKPTLKSGDYVRIKGAIKMFRGHPKINGQADDTERLTEPPENVTDYQAGPNDSVLDVYEQELLGFIDQIDDEDIKHIVQNSLDPKRIDLLHMLRSYPYKTEGPLACRGGLLIFATQLIRTALALADSTYDIELPINRSLIIVGCLLHDIGFVANTQFTDDTWESRDSAFLFGSTATSFLMANHVCMTTESDLNIKLPEAKKLALQAICTNSSRIIESVIVTKASDFVQLSQLQRQMIQFKEPLASWDPSNNLFVGHHDQRDS